MTAPDAEGPPKAPPGPPVACDPRILAVIERAPPLRSALLDEIRDLLPPADRRHGEAGDDAA